MTRFALVNEASGICVQVTDMEVSDWQAPAGHVLTPDPRGNASPGFTHQPGNQEQPFAPPPQLVPA